MINLTPFSFFQGAPIPFVKSQSRFAPNPKSEVLNPKQIQIFKFKTFSSFGFWSFDIV